MDADNREPKPYFRSTTVDAKCTDLAVTAAETAVSTATASLGTLTKAAGLLDTAMKKALKDKDAAVLAVTGKDTSALSVIKSDDDADFAYLKA